MFPNPNRFGDDPNRRRRQKPAAEGERPVAAQWSYYCAVAAAVLMLAVSFMMLSQGWMSTTYISPEAVATLELNHTIVAWGNIIGAIGLGLSAPFLIKGSQVGRRLLAGFFTLAIFLNLAGLIVMVAGLVPALLIITVSAFGLVFAFRPSVNHYVRERSA